MRLTDYKRNSKSLNSLPEGAGGTKINRPNMDRNRIVAECSVIVAKRMNVKNRELFEIFALCDYVCIK